MDRDLHTILGTVYRAAQQIEKSRDVIQSFFAEYPSDTNTPSHHNSARILCTLGADRTVYLFEEKEDGSTKKIRRGGHFTLKFLLDKDNYHFTRYYIARDNINKIPPKAPYDLILNTIADPDIELSSLKSLNIYLAKKTDVKILNHPSKVISTSRDGNYKTFKDIEGFYFPQTERIFSDDRNAKAIAADIEGRGFTYPLIIRRPGTHTALSTALVHNKKEMLNYIHGEPSESYYAIEFVKNANKDGHYSKIRFFVIDGVLYPVVYHIDEVWNVHGENRKTFMSANNWMMERERQFLNDPVSVIGQDVYKKLQMLPKLIGLDFFGIDFTIMNDGQILIFELNPAMRHSFDHAKSFPYVHQHMLAITNAFTNMVNKNC